LILLNWALSAALASGSAVASDRAAGGEHWRLLTAKGPVHVWRPVRYDRHRAGTVVYVHGFSSDADTAWEQHDLARQFEASRRNALFIVPEAPANPEDRVVWPNLDELLRAVGTGLKTPLPGGPLVVMGHSAAHLTLVPWLRNPRIGHVILLDAIYGDDVVGQLRAWLRKNRGRLVVAAADTAEDSEHLLLGLASTVRCGPIPETEAGFTPVERGARVAYFRSQYGHLELVTGGKAIAPLLCLTRLPSLALHASTLLPSRVDVQGR
jgi:hypothetical protein